MAKRTPQRKPRAGLIDSLWRKIFDNFITSIAGAIFALSATLGLLIWTPLRNKLSDGLTDRKNITYESALQISRKTIGSETAWAIPFRNRGEDIQYIAAWYENYEPACDLHESTRPSWCDLRLGPYDLDILTGKNGTYERNRTHITAGIRAGGAYRETTSAADAASSTVRFWGITDIDHDGKKEILSIADSTGTAPILPIYVSIYEIGSGEIRQLRSYPSRTHPVKNEFYNATSSTIKAWLLDRLTEFRDSTDDPCERDGIGKLTCTGAAARPFTQDEKWLIDAQDRWLSDNGIDLTKGNIRIRWSAGKLHAEPGQCIGHSGNIEWLNVFKGPLVINDLTNKRRAIAYLQDESHHREIPTLIFGKKYTWLALVTSGGIIAIDNRNLELQQFDAPELHDATPPYSHESIESLEAESKYEYVQPKDFQLSDLTLSEGRLVHESIPLSLPVDDEEFLDATACHYN